MRFRGLAEAALATGAAAALACLLTFPYVLEHDHAGRVDTNDGKWSIWVVAWVAHALTTDPLSVYQANIFHPQRNALTFSEANLVEGALGVPAWLLTRNAFTTHNSVFILSFVISTLGMYYLARHLSASRAASAVAAVLFAYCPFVFARTAHVQLLFVGFLPFCLLSFHRLVERPSVWRAVELGVVLWIQGLACAYYGIYAGGMVGLGVIWFAVTRGRLREGRYWAAIAVAAVVCLGLTLPFFLPYIELQQAGFARGLEDVRRYSANLRAWGASAAWAHRWWLPAIQGFSEVLFPGLMAIGFGLAGAWLALRRPARSAAPPDTPAPAPPGRLTRDVAAFYAATGVLAFWLTFGPKAGLYLVFHNYVPVFSFLRAPARTGIIVTLCLVVLATVALVRLIEARRRPLVAAFVLGALAVADLVQAPLRMRESPPFSDAHYLLARLPRGPVAEFPYWYNRMEFPRHAEYMLPSTVHWQPLVNGYSDHIPREFRDHVRAMSTFPSRESFALLEAVGARYAVFHMDLLDPRSHEKLVTRIEVDYKDYLRPLHKEGQVWLFEIIGWPR